ncbi:MAG: PaaI family thioesterase [Alphaproteobacteria bacterium]|nr:PaaI family thioesterase [Alphaproteobacteria bacterium]
MPDSIDLASYSVFTPPDPFEDHVGPFYYRIAGDARDANAVHCVLPTEERHGNYAGGVHGGAILTFADYALCLVAGRAADGGTNTSFALTVSIAVEFLDAGRTGLPLESTGEPLQVTGRLGRVQRLGDFGQIVPVDFEHLATASIYSRHIGPSYGRKEENGATLIQPTLPHMCNSGGALHGGYMMSFADSAVTRAAALTTGMAPSTVAFAAEFLSGGQSTSPLTTRVEVPRHGKSLAFVRGLLEQDGRKLLSYSSTIKLRARP